MLFSRVYNWIKYKTLPPSVLFMNRLFVERDSKHRRVTSNLGLTFRNSKWSSYARVNINIQSQSSYFKFLYSTTSFILLLIVLAKFTSYYDITILFTPVYTLVWFLFDGDLYLKAVFASSLLCTLQLTASSLYAKLFQAVTIPSQDTTLESQYTLPKRLHKPLLYLWSSQASDGASVFNTTVTSESSNSSLLLLKHLYSAVHLLKIQSQSYYSLSSTLNNLEQPTSNLTTLESYNLRDRHLTLGLEYMLMNSYSKGSTNSHTELTAWSLPSIHNELTGFNLELNFREGPFYLTDISTSKLNSLSLNFGELTPLKSSVENQLKLIRWNRWLYKFNLLHRKSLRSASNLTFAKRLISSGFHKSSNTSSNLWSSSIFENSSNTMLNVAAVTNSVYASQNKQSWLPYSNSQSNASLGFYEESYHWFIKRFYLFNSLPTNQISLFPVLKSDGLDARLSNLRALEYEQSLLDVNTSLALNALTPKSSTLNTSSVLSSSTTDLHLDYSNLTLFSQRNTEILLNLSANSSNKASSFYPLSFSSSNTYPKNL